MEKISELMDGESQGQESSLHIRRLGQDPRLCETWETYHLIRDVMRNEAGVGFGLAQRVHELLKAEPIIVAPHTRLVARVTRYSLPMAAAVAGVAVVGWLALAVQPHLNGTQTVARAPASAVSQPTSLAAERGPNQSDLPAVVAIPVSAPANGQMDEYLVAHQEFSPSTAMLGGAPYMRLPNGDTTAQ